MKAHIPMIKFRKGSLIPKSAPVLPESTVAPTISAAAPAPSSSANTVEVVNLEWWQTPEKFKRRTVDQLECDLINVSYFIRPKYISGFDTYIFFSSFRMEELI